MPLVEITFRSPRSPELVRSIGDAVHEALVAEANVPADDRFQIFHLLPAEGVIAHPTYGGVNRGEGLVIIRITLNAGRTTDVKKKLYAEIAGRLERVADIRPDDVLICLVETSKENWSFGKGIATYA